MVSVADLHGVASSCVPKVMDDEQQRYRARELQQSRRGGVYPLRVEYLPAGRNPQKGGSRDHDRIRAADALDVHDRGDCGVK